MAHDELVAELQRIGRQAGLDAVGIAAATPFADTRRHLEERKAAGLHAGYAEAWTWLAEMHERATSGTPPVAEAEFAALARWFQDNEARLGPPSQPLDLGDGRRVVKDARRFS